MRAFAYCDGEQIQIEAFINDMTSANLARALIDLGKSPASCSATCQSSDAGKFFKAMKKLLAGIVSRTWQNDSLKQALQVILSERPSLDTQKARLIDGFQKIICAMRCVMKDETIKEGYSCIGQWPFNFRIIMSKCTRTIPNEDMENMVAKLPIMRAYFSEHGRLSEAFMDDHHIMSVNDESKRQLPKDQRILSHERAILLTAEDSISKYRQNEYYKAFAEEAARERADERERVKAIQDEAKRTRDNERRVKIAQRDAAKAAKMVEKRRFDALSSEEQRAERAEKRRRIQVAKSAAALTIPQDNQENIAIANFDDGVEISDLFDDDLFL